MRFFENEQYIFLYLTDVVNSELKHNPDNPYEITLITTNNEKIKRVRLTGTVVDKYFSQGTDEKKTYTALVIDDGTDTLRLKGWEETAEIMNECIIGDEIEAYGKPNKDENERYIVPDKVVIIKDYERELYLRALKVRRYVQNKLKLPKKRTEQDNEETERDKAKEEIRGIIFDRIKGIKLSELIDLTNLERSIIEEAIQDLANDGEIFEPETGLFKKV